MDYVFLDQDDERLLELAEMPVQGGIAVALRSTGYDPKSDEIVEIAISDLDGRLLFHTRAKPQNIDEWSASSASGGLAPEDVIAEPELYQCEDEIRALFEQASIAVFEHAAFATALIESSWIALPDCAIFDLDEEFRLSHADKDRAGEPASAVSLPQVIRYYGLKDVEGGVDLSDEAALVAQSYRAFVAEGIREREAKGSAYWEARERRIAQQDAQDVGARDAQRLREKRLNQMNALLWVSGAIIFVSLVIQLSQRGGDPGLMLVAGAASVFCAMRAYVNFRK